ncbi:hypothetical protein AWB77_03891 [Caballeronia fortuita]|uniref:Purine nucleoside phosphorylase n=1 Tax=Caballeronia fortuita TaxID=1777138 RepID=A0A158CB17_9BURK|nr:hypothetical protein [Caballeronia fortuita]SAK79545.1 hypothetical protein AWB77_03891 [Caballeronia fortuita]
MSRVIQLIFAFSLSFIVCFSAQAQDATAVPAASSAAPTSNPISKAADKAERKRQRKEARARKNAELKKLESSGYRPTQNDPSYPHNLQDAQKKAGTGTGPTN